MSLLQKLQALKVKPRYVLVDGEWTVKTEPILDECPEYTKGDKRPWYKKTAVGYVALPTADEKEDWPTCGAPVVGKPCPKCNGSTVIVFHDRRAQTCHWCTGGKGTITMKDRKYFDLRVFKGLPLCFIKTMA
jgi:hypothetical protein